MAAVALHGLFLNDAADLTDAQVFTKGEIRLAVTSDVRVQKYANGRTRAVTRPGRQRSLSVSLMLLDKTQSWWLKEHEGRRVLARDPAGNLIFGVYADATFAESPWNETADASFTIVELS